MSDPYSQLRDQYDDTWERVHKLEDEASELRGELARLRQQQVRWADNIRSALNVEPTLAQPISVEYLIGILVALETELRG